ncbi:hypothetical protein JG687_00016518 [Phytophthora cactorum]|uniref:ZSWIM1/3 RNaseH-like domain-containing protein n=1 Tax=Phytophthora cactorum TaxID=29920 RepID=A0A8T1TQH9_9STRA|nr:hypothetical protein JG687_00016518 [Phytophthora cactorum]
MDGYQEIMHQVFRQRTAVSVRKRNRATSGQLRPVTYGTTTPDVAARLATAGGGAEEETTAVLPLSGQLVVRELCESLGNRATVFEDEKKTAQTIIVQTRQMRRWFKAFPEVLLIVATHNTNDSRYKLFSFMVNDVYGDVSRRT